MKSQSKLKALAHALSFALEFKSSSLRLLSCFCLIALPLAGLPSKNSQAAPGSPGMAAPITTLLLEPTKLQPFSPSPQRASTSFSAFILPRQVILTALSSSFIRSTRIASVNQRQRLISLQKLQLEGG